MAEHDIFASDRDAADVFSELIRRWGEKAYNFAYRLSGNEHDARDLVQEALVRAYEHRDRYDPTRPFDSWLNRILHNIYLDGVRRYSHGHTVSLDVEASFSERAWSEILPGKDVDPTDAMVRRDDEAMIQRALAELPIPFRTAVTLCDIEGVSYEDISRIMACPIGTVRSRIHQGRSMMRKSFEAWSANKGGKSDA